jgi:hypothetical protein
VIILQHDFDAPEGGRLFTLYGHLQTIAVQTGQRVNVGDQIGTVGMTGIAMGSHLHFEVRIGNPEDYFAVRNPELWLKPLSGTGLLVGRMVDVNGNPAVGGRYVLSTASRVFPSFTYVDTALHADPAYNENFAMTDLPAGCYQMRVRGGTGYAYNERVCITAGKATFVDAKLTQ